MQALQAHGGAASVQGGEIVKNEGVKVGDAPKGETHVANAVADRTGATTVLPIPLDRNDSQVVRSLRGGRLGECAIAVEVPDKLPEGPSAITELWAPEGKRVIQIGSEKCMPQSMFGKALNYAAKVATQVCVYSDDGTAYFAQGVYAYAPIGKNNWFEIQYYPEAEVPERCLKPMNKLTDSILKQTKESERRLGFIFVVPPGTKIVAFSAGKDRQSISGVQAPP